MRNYIQNAFESNIKMFNKKNLPVDWLQQKNDI